MPSAAWAKEGWRAIREVPPMFYTYILRSLSDPEQRYIGSTSDLRSRLAKHNKGDVPHTAKFRPWKLEAYFAFEQYLKSGSGHAFAKRHF